MWQFPKKSGLVVVAGALSLVLLAACTGDDDANGTSTVGLTGSQLDALTRAGTLVGSGYSQGTGIHVQGVGTVTAEPDVAVISLGVEGFAKTVTEARNIAATAMDGLLKALKDNGVADADLQTQFFNIQPEYSYEEIVVPRGDLSEGTIRRSERVLIGYRVTNTLTAKVRELDKVGDIIDAVVDAGGDATRLNSIQFTVDDGTVLEAQARELALEDALAKADLFADKLSAKRGKLQFVSETSSPRFPKVEAAFDQAVASRAAGIPATQVSPGQFEVTVNVQAIFAID